MVPQAESNWWSSGTHKGKPVAHVDFRFYVTNIHDSPVRICAVTVRKHRSTGFFMVRSVRSDIYGDYSIPTGCATEATAHFRLDPTIGKPDAHLVLDIDIIDQFANRHRIRNIEFRSRPKSEGKPKEPQMESVSDLGNPVEREVVAVLQAEVHRYRACGRGAGGLGSIQTIYRDHSHRGVGSDWRTTDSPLLQAIVPDPDSARIESDNATALIRFYGSLKNEQVSDFVISLLKRLSREEPYAPIGYFIFFVLYRVGHMKKALEKAKKSLQHDSAYGFSDLLRLLDGLLKFDYTKFSTEMLDDIDRFLPGIQEHTFAIPERLASVRAVLLAKRMEKGKE